MGIINLGKKADREMVAPYLDEESAISGQITVPTAGAAVAGGDIDLVNGVRIKALLANTNPVFVGNDGSDDITSGNSFQLAAGDEVRIQVFNLSQLYFDVTTNGEGFSWIME